MTEEELGSGEERHPVLAGLLALLAVGLTVGLVLGLATLGATKVLGVGGDGSASGDSSVGASLFLPRPQKTDGPTGPLITLDATDEGKRRADRPSKSPTQTEEEEETISLSAGQTSVGVMEPIDLTGVYPGGEGAILQVQRFTDGSWSDFPVTTPVSNETFSTYIQSSQTGVNRLRMVDTASGLESNEVKVRIE